jgi:hypothetical protein
MDPNTRHLGPTTTGCTATISPASVLRRGDEEQQTRRQQQLGHAATSFTTTQLPTNFASSANNSPCSSVERRAKVSRGCMTAARMFRDINKLTLFQMTARTAAGGAVHLSSATRERLWARSSSGQNGVAVTMASTASSIGRNRRLSGNPNPSYVYATSSSTSDNLNNGGYRSDSSVNGLESLPLTNISNYKVEGTYSDETFLLASSATYSIV